MFRDTAGQERFAPIGSMYYHGAKAVIFTYDITQVTVLILLIFEVRSSIVQVSWGFCSLMTSSRKGPLTVFPGGGKSLRRGTKVEKIYIFFYCIMPIKQGATACKCWWGAKPTLRRRERSPPAKVRKLRKKWNRGIRLRSNQGRLDSGGARRAL